MNQDDQRLVLMAAAAQAHYAKHQARREARKAALLSQVSALSNSGQPMDPKLQAVLERLIRAEAQRTEQENFDWACGMVVGCHRVSRLRFVHLDSNGSRPLKNSARQPKHEKHNVQCYALLFYLARDQA